MIIISTRDFIWNIKSRIFIYRKYLPGKSLNEDVEHDNSTDLNAAIWKGQSVVIQSEKTDAYVRFDFSRGNMIKHFPVEVYVSAEDDTLEAIFFFNAGGGHIDIESLRDDHITFNE